MKSRFLTWIKFKEEKKDVSKRNEILNYIKLKGETTIKEIEKDLKLRQSTLSGRISELSEAGLIKIVRKEKIGKYYYSVYSFVEDENERLKISYEYLKDKYEIHKRKTSELYNKLFIIEQKLKEIKP